MLCNLLTLFILPSTWNKMFYGERNIKRTARAIFALNCLCQTFALPYRQHFQIFWSILIHCKQQEKISCETGFNLFMKRTVFIAVSKQILTARLTRRFGFHLRVLQPAVFNIVVKDVKANKPDEVLISMACMNIYGFLPSIWFALPVLKYCIRSL